MTGKRLSARTIITIVLVPIMAMGCANRQYATPEEAIQNACSALGPRAVSGALIGGATGALGGAAIGAAAGNGKGAAIGAGVGLLVGIAAGIAAGNHMDQQDCQQAQIALQQIENQPINQPIAWRNPATGSSGVYTPISAQYTLNSHICRQVQANYNMENHQPVYGDTGVICRDAQGNWGRIVSQS